MGAVVPNEYLTPGFSRQEEVKVALSRKATAMHYILVKVCECLREEGTYSLRHWSGEMQ